MTASETFGQAQEAQLADAQTTDDGDEDTGRLDAQQSISDKLDSAFHAQQGNIEQAQATLATERGGMAADAQEQLMQSTVMQALEPIPFRVPPQAMSQVTDPTLIARAIQSADAEGDTDWSLQWKAHQAGLNRRMDELMDPAQQEALAQTNAIADQMRADQELRDSGYRGLVGQQALGQRNAIEAAALKDAGVTSRNDLEQSVAHWTQKLADSKAYNPDAVGHAEAQLATANTKLSVFEERLAAFDSQVSAPEHGGASLREQAATSISDKLREVGLS